MLKIMFKIKYVFLLIVFNKNIFEMENNNHRYTLYNILRDNIELEDYLELDVNENNVVLDNNNRNNEVYNILELFTLCNIDPDTARIYIRTTLSCVLYFVLMYNLYKLMFDINNVVNYKNVNYHY